MYALQVVYDTTAYTITYVNMNVFTKIDVQINK